MEIFFIFVLFVIVILVSINYIMKYYNGDYTIVSSEILREGKLRDIYTERQTGYYYDVKIVYKSGRIRIKSYEF